MCELFETPVFHRRKRYCVLLPDESGIYTVSFRISDIKKSVTQVPYLYNLWTVVIVGVFGFAVGIALASITKMLYNRKQERTIDNQQQAAEIENPLFDLDI